MLRGPRICQQLIICSVVSWCFCGIPAAVLSDISLPKIFSDSMVLQRNSSVKIWGTADPAQKIVVSFQGQQSAIVADKQGNWSTWLKTADAGGPYQLLVAAEVGEPKVVFSDVMVGEVWICSGQSNMKWQMTDILNPETEIEQSKNYPNLRLFTVQNQASTQPLKNFVKVNPWRVCSPESVRDFSATAYFFGRELSKQLDSIPIGLINTAWDSTPAEAWISRPMLNSVESLKPLLDYWNENNSPALQNRPAALFNGMIAPLTHFKTRGAIWYQGESNNGRGQQYATLLPTLIQDWRNTFGNQEYPFYFVQLAPFRYTQLAAIGLPEIWDAQLKTLRATENTGMIVTTDIGDPKDIHPRNKQEVGRRLALVALAKLYQAELPPDNRSILYNGPLYKSSTINGSEIKILFEHVGDGLKSQNPDEPLTYFQICGEDRVFVPATATIAAEGNMLSVSAAEVPAPIAVRFGWTDTAEPNLVNSAGLPASPFRTDEFPMESAGRDF